MPGGKKKATANQIPMDEDTEDSPPSDDTDEEDEELDENEDDAYKSIDMEEIQVDFMGREPIDSDADGICQMLKQLFLKAHVNWTEMADFIIGQNYIGSVLVQSEDDEEDYDDDLADNNAVLGITTVINLTAKKNIPCVEQLRNYILQRAQSHATDAAVKHFKSLLESDDKPVGFLLNERYVNIPAKISIPLLEHLKKEIDRANQKNMPFNFAYYLMILKFHRDESQAKKSGELLYANPEEEVICQEAENSFEFSVLSESDYAMVHPGNEDTSFIPCRKMILFEADKLPNIIASIKEFVDKF